MNSIERQPTMALRFVERDGKKILQQMWISTPSDWTYGYGDRPIMREWIDVPLEDEADDKMRDR